MNNFREQVSGLIGAMDAVILDKTPVIKTALAAVLAGGHVLLEDVPGLDDLAGAYAAPGGN